MSETIGLIAGNGAFPILFARAAKAKGVRVVAVAMRGETQSRIASEVDALTWVRVGQLGKMIDALRGAGVRRAAMAGGVRKTRLFSGARPDWLGLRLLARQVIRPDDGLLRAVAAEFERHAIEIVDSTLYLPEMLAPVGVLSGRAPTAGEWADLRYGLRIARDIGRLDVGQAAVVKEGAVVALEAMEGTDACVQRAGAIIGGRGGVLVKVAKPDQDMRFDVPAIGPKTIEACAAAGITVVGVEAGRTLVLEAQRVIELANGCDVCVVGLGDGDDAAQATTP